METLKHVVAAKRGRTVSTDSRWTVAHARLVHDGTADVPDGPVSWVGWHASNLIALRFMRKPHDTRRPPWYALRWTGGSDRAALPGLWAGVAGGPSRLRGERGIICWVTPRQLVRRETS
jgi:hypothetical protein